MIPVLSVVTSVKDYLEVVHKLIEYDSDSFSQYTELGPIVTYFVLSLKSFFVQFFSLSWLKNLWSLPIIIPDISSAMISEISVLDGYFHNAFQVLDTPTLSPNEKTIGLITGLEKLTIGLLNSFFLFLPTSTAHIITLRRFVMQGLDAGYISGLGTIAGNLFWLASVLLGWRFFVIPWLSLDILRYLLGFALLVKYMWDSYNERKSVLQDLSKRKIFLFNFLLALTEQTSIYPFISNISVSPEASVLESFPADNYPQFLFLHMSYLAGIALGSFCLLQLTCWFWENPAFQIYTWVISSFKVSTGFYYKALNFLFLYLTMLSAISSIPYYGLDYTITNPLGFVNDDRLVQDKTVLETSFLGTKSSDRNTRRNRGRHGRRERWKRRIRKYRTFDASLYDQGIYDLFTIEDLNYGFDRFWLRRKLRNHRVRFRFFPGPWMRSFKKQLAKPRLESYTGPRIEFFRTLFEQVYHPSFHARTRGSQGSLSSLDYSVSMPKNSLNQLTGKNLLEGSSSRTLQNMNSMNGTYGIKKDFRNENSMLRKFVRKLDSRLKTSEIIHSIDPNNLSLQFNKSFSSSLALGSQNSKKIYSKRWKEIFSKIYHEPKEQISSSKLFFKNVHRNFYNSSLTLPKQINIKFLDSLDEKQKKKTLNIQSESVPFSSKKATVKKQSSGLNTLSNKDLQILRYRSTLTSPLSNTTTSVDKPFIQPFVLLHPLKFYLQQEASLQRKLRYYTPNIFRKFSVENNAPYFRVMMRRYFYNYKPTSRWERTMQVASLRKARRKTTRTPRKLRLPQLSISKTNIGSDSKRTKDQKNNVDGGINDLSGRLSRTNGPLGTSGENLNMNALGLRTNKSFRLAERLEKPTFNYSVVSKKASRYRYQIYKDVMQHWYYSPFNRLFLKFDVDNFIKRQPKTHFLTSNEENLLHLRRFFLSEHYNTLRWYTNMEHYRTMKTQIGGSKSFSSRAYNQQFTGTFKKIRHLFSISPTINSSFPFDSNGVSQALAKSSRINLNSTLSQQENLSGRLARGASPVAFFFEKGSPSGGPVFKENGTVEKPKVSRPPDDPRRGSLEEPSSFNASTTVLKFDQPLYNEYPNNSKNPLLNPLVIHEELLNDRSQQMSAGNLKALSTPNQDLLSQSQNIVRNSLINASQERNEYIKELLKNNNYSLLTQFLYNGQKLRGNSPTLNQKSLGSQEKEYLLTDLEKDNIEKQYNSPNIKRLLRQNFSDFVSIEKPKGIPSGVALQISRPPEGGEGTPFLEKTVTDSSLSLEESGARKENKSQPLTGGAALDNLYTTFLKNWKYRVNNQESLKNYLTRRIDKREKTKIAKEKNLQQKLKLLNSWSANSPDFKNLNIRTSNNSSLTSGFNLSAQDTRIDDSFSSKLYNSESITSGLQKAIIDGKKTANLDSPFSPLPNSRNESSSLSKLSLLRIRQKNKLNREIQISTNKLHNITKQLDEKPLSVKTVFFLKKKVRLLLKDIKKTYGGLSFFNFNKILYLVKPMKQKTIQNWRQKQRSIGKQKRLRKEFKLLLTKKQATQQNVFNLPNRKKRSDSQSVNLEYTNSKKSLDLNDVLSNDSSGKSSFFKNRYITSFFNFKRERSPQRRYRVRRNRGVFRKRNLGDLMKKDISVFYNKTTLSDSLLLPQNTIERNKFYSKMYSLFGKTTVENPVAVFKQNGESKETKDFSTIPFLNKIEGESRFLDKRSEKKATEEQLDLGSESNFKSLLFKEERIKQRKNKQRKLRSWKQKRMSIRSAQKRRKYLKRRRYTISKIRVLSKQFQRVKNKLEVQNWWWRQYLPSIQASTDALWQIEKDRLVQQKLSELSPQEILNRDSNRNLSKGTSSNKLQIGNKDFKPLALPEAIRLQSSLQSLDTQNTILASNQSAGKDSFLPSSDVPFEDKSSVAFFKENGVPPPPFGGRETKGFSTAQKESFVSVPFSAKKATEEKTQTELINQLYTNLFANKNMKNFVSNSSAYTGLLPNTSLPFYAGWDESLRKFVVTNRLLSRQDAGYEVDNSFVESNLSFVEETKFPRQNSPFSKKTEESPFENQNILSDSNSHKKEKFTEAPLQGMNAATTLYWQIPFTTYDPDQFFALGMDGFSPIAWRKMVFRHSILKSWLGDKMMLNKKMDLSYPQENKSIIGIKNSSNHQDLLNTLKKYKTLREEKLKKTNSQDGFNNVRNLNKRLLRVKKHPRTPVWFPSGPLLNQVLPVHYIYVFYKRSRLPRNRYLSRRLLSINNINNNESLNLLKSSNPAYYNYDFTLRKRLKPKRKYHLKHDSSIVIPRRFKLLNLTNINSSQKQTTYDQFSLIRWRPLSPKKINKSFAQLMNEQKTLRAKRQQRLANPSQTDQPSLRVKQLKRRVQRQTIRSVWRYRPRAGGYVWPGDYLKLEMLKIPKLKHTNLKTETATQNKKDLNIDNSTFKQKTKRKKKRTLVEWQIQPKKYHYAKHNMNVLKRKLEKAQRSGNLSLQKKLKEVEYTI